MKTTFAFDHYYLYTEMKEMLDHFAAAYPDLCTLEVICVTEKGRNEYAMTITNKKTGDALSKPAYYMDGTIHAGEVTASMVCLYTIDYLLTNYGSDANITELVDTQAFYVLPRISPDGAEAYLTTEAYMYSADRPWKEKFGGLNPLDINNDGIVSIMRVKDKHGIWKIDPNDSDLMVRRMPDDRHGDFYSLYREGTFEPYDGDENVEAKKMKWGMNFNRNFPYGWFPDSREPGAGEYPLSFPETRAQAMFIMNHPNICGITALHTTAGMILFPPGTKPEKKGNPKDMALFRAIGEMGTEETGYPTVNVFDAFLADQENFSSGALDDWAYQGLGIPAYTVELWNLAVRAGKPEDMTARLTGALQDKQERYAAYVNWVKQNAPDAFIPWTEYDHPHFGKVEIGGYAYKFVQQNPPKHFLLQECEKVCRFMVRFAGCLPHIEIESLTAENIHDDVYEVTAVVANTGYMSTNLTQEAIGLKMNKPVTVSIDASDLMMGKAVEEIGDLEGFSETVIRIHYGLPYSTRDAKSRRKVKWHVIAAPGTKLTVHADHEKAGHAAAEVTL